MPPKKTVQPEPEPEDERPEDEEAMARIAEQIGEADSVEDVLAGPKATPADSILNTPLLIRSWEMREGEYSPFAIIEAIYHSTGEVVDPPISCGGKLVLAALRRLDELNGFPVVCQIVKKGRAFRLIGVEEA